MTFNNSWISYLLILKILIRGKSWIRFIFLHFRSLNEVHVDFGRIEGMSTRRGDVVFLQDILDEGKAQMIEVMRNKSSKHFFLKET